MSDTVALHPAGPRDAWIAAGQAILMRRSSASWDFADWLADEDFPAGTTDEGIAGALGVSRRKIGQYREISRVYPNGSRLPSLGFSHYMEVYRLPPDDAERILGAADAEGWNRAATRAAAREASLKGKLARQRREIAELKRALKAARTDPRDAVKQARSRLGAEQRVVRDACERIAEAVEGLAEDGALDGLHGNARRGVARDIRRAAVALVRRVNLTIDRVEAAVERLGS